MSVHEIIIKISKICSIFIPKHDIEESNNIPANREAMRYCYEDFK
ncbi:hypothetical protein A1C_04870 [Rickettsia akari str. Hartford]|uniref:Uncharacterized protein n=1 Tax=Rickettsia akari (strain Hartford) TaxID=293614 RepID=A8GPA7_RICAH|nr:hypothetical protein [Rickettsia akari]ABV75232.1 hypothetical protein A1C_04870 [Rickettsia akari str. Hartford]